VPDDAEIQNALLAIYSRLGTIEGKVNLVARADRAKVIDVLEEAFRKDPLLSQIYLLLDGKRTQQEVVDELARFGITPSQPTVSRRMANLVTEYGVADPAGTGGGAVLRKNRAAEDVLNLTKRVRGWLTSAGLPIPEDPVRKPRRSRE